MSRTFMKSNFPLFLKTFLNFIINCLNLTSVEKRHDHALADGRREVLPLTYVQLAVSLYLEKTQIQPYRAFSLLVSNLQMYPTAV